MVYVQQIRVACVLNDENAQVGITLLNKCHLCRAYIFESKFLNIKKRRGVSEFCNLSEVSIE